MTRPTSVLFVCYANVCRSPLAEGIFRALVEAERIGDHFEIDSAGTCAMEGSAPHAHSCEVALAHNIALTSTARQLRREDLDRFDHILLMDRSNLRQVRRLVNPRGFGGLEHYRAKLRLLGALAPGARRDAEIPDPIGHGAFAYAKLFDTLRPACIALLEELRPRVP